MIGHALNQTATYWGPGQPDGFGGTTWPAPVVLRVRWQDKQQQIRDRDGVERMSGAVVYTEAPVQFGGRLAKGEHTEPDPTAVDSWPILAYEEMVDLSGETMGWKVFV